MYFAAEFLLFLFRKVFEMYLVYFANLVLTAKNGNAIGKSDKKSVIKKKKVYGKETV